MAGYAGGYGRVRDHVRSVRPRQPVEAVGALRDTAGLRGSRSRRVLCGALCQIAVQLAGLDTELDRPPADRQQSRQIRSSSGPSTPGCYAH